MHTRDSRGSSQVSIILYIVRKLKAPSSQDPDPVGSRTFYPPQIGPFGHYTVIWTNYAICIFESGHSRCLGITHNLL
jgi:hypothetical protein